VSDYGTPIMTLGGGFFAGPVGGAKCAYNGSNQRFECAPQTENGLTMTLWYQYLDAGNKPLSAYNKSTVNAIHTHTTTHGTITDNAGGQSFSLTLSGESDQTMGGLLGTTQTLTGTSNETMSFPGSPAITFATTTNLTLPARGSQGYPTGTITMTISEPGSSTETFTMTFDGTSTVTINMNGATCTMDLSKPDDPGTCTQLYAARSQLIPASAISGGVRWPPRNSR
jgi:hypothetical protein